MSIILMMISSVAFRAAPYMIAGAVGMAVIIGAYQTGVRAERKRGEADALRAQIVTLRADIAIARQAEADAAARATAIEAAAAADQRIVEEVRNAPSIPACRLSERDARRLSRIGAGARP